MRLFSAVGVPEEIAQQLLSVRGGLIDAKWIEAEDLHVTLAFFGELDRSQANDLAQALSEIEASAIEVRLAGLGVFGADRPRALVALAQKSPALLSLEATHRSICSRLGIPLETRRYTPHVTLARLRRTHADDVAAWLSQQPVFPAYAWTAQRFAIYSTRTSRGGGPYVAEFEVPLGAAGG